MKAKLYFPRKNKGFRVIEILLALAGIIAIIAISAAFWYISGHKAKVTTIDPNKQIVEINSLLMTAGIEKLNNWYVGADCGPTDAFEGYVLRHDAKEISPEQATKLKSAATKANINVINAAPGPNPASYTIKKNSWDIQVISYVAEHSSLFVRIRLKEKIAGFPYKRSFCG
jgi:hypothetical protein